MKKTLVGHRGFRNVAGMALVLAWLGSFAGFGAPAAEAQVPPGYYDTVDTTAGAGLRATLHEVIDDHTRFPYTSSSTDTWDILNLADEDPNNPDNIIDLYQNASYTKISGGVGAYNREHSWPKSYGFPNDGSTNYPYTDCHHLFVADGGYNSSRSNKPFRYCTAACSEKTTLFNDGRGGGSGVYPGNSNWTTGSFSSGTWETWGGRRGDVARAMFYMDLRYEGGLHNVTGVLEPDLELTDDDTLIDMFNTGDNESLAFMGILGDLLIWHQEDPVDSREVWRNEVVFTFQGNRNPFIDHPEWVDCIYNNVCTLDSTPPDAPSSLLTTAQNGAVDLSWLANGEPDLDGYNVYRSTVSGSGYVRVNGPVVTTNGFTDTGLVNGTTYFYVVTAIDTSSNESTFSNEASATPDGGLPDLTPPGMPTGFTASGGDAEVQLAWNANGEVDLAGYDVWRSTTLGGPYTQVNVVLITATSFLDTGLANGTTYYYAVSAVDTSNNESALSEEASATPQLLGSGGVVLSEVLYDVSGSDTGWEWVELFNGGSAAVDLSGFSLGNGGGDYTTSLVQLSGIIAVGETFLVGGPTSGATNSLPTFDQEVDFSPDFQNSGTAADGVALFDLPAAQVTASTVPVDAVVYGPTNSNSLIDETGVANPPEVGDAGAGSSIERVDPAGVWQIQTVPTPNTTPLAGPGNAAPNATITAPPNGSSFTEGTSISFTGTASDSEDGDLTSSLSWTSSLDGVLGSGGAFSSLLSVGTHSVTASVTDSGGLSGSDAITVTVDAAGGGPVIVTLTSVGAEDGWVRESNETSGVGGRNNSTASDSRALRVGDDRRDRQLDAIVSFDTSSIPDGATIVSATLRLRRGRLIGSNPFNTHGTCRVDVRSGGFGGNTALANSDFEAAPTATAVAALSNAAADLDWSEGALAAAGLAAVNKVGTTQFRIYFDLDDNDDRGNDYMGYYSGDNGSSANHPRLVVTYQE